MTRVLAILILLNNLKRFNQVPIVIYLHVVNIFIFCNGSYLNETFKSPIEQYASVWVCVFSCLFGCRLKLAT